MPNLKDIRSRIRSVKNTQQITRAMKMIAASRLRKAQEAILAKRPYAQRLREVIATLAVRADDEDHPLLQVREPKNVMLLVLTSDRGMCGGFNANINRTTARYIQESADRHERIELSVIGKKGELFFGKRKSQFTIAKTYRRVFEEIGIDKAGEIGEDIISSYKDNGLDAVYMVYNEFKSAISQRVVVEQLLPVERPGAEEADASLLDFIYEPSKEAVLDQVLPLYVNMQIYRAVLESIASEMGARMTAMDAATRNASELIASLTLQYNRARQAAITKELMEIIGGAEALKG